MNQSIICQVASPQVENVITSQWKVSWCMSGNCQVVLWGHGASLQMDHVSTNAHKSSSKLMFANGFFSIGQLKVKGNF